MEWQQLEYFRVVARLEHFTRAAEQLAISQPALSRSIAALEEEIGVPFFKREGRSVRLNRYGHLFLQHVERALAEIEKGKKKIDDLLNPERGLVSLAFLHTLGAQLIPSLLREFREANPFVRFQLYQNSAQHILTQLEAGEIDLCFTSPPVRRPGFGWVDLLEEKLVLLVPRHHRLAGRGTVRLDEVANDPFICMKHGYGLRSITENLCREAGFRPQVAFEGEEVTTVAGLVAAGLGIALIPEVSGLNQEKTVCLEVSEPRCRRMIGMAWREGGFMPLPVLKFRTFVMQRLG